MSTPRVLEEARPTARRRLATRAERELTIVIVLFCVGGIIGMEGVQSYMHAGFKPFFYQTWFGAAVMEACGRGYHDVAPAAMPPALKDFLDVRREMFDCAELPATLVPAPTTWFQQLYRYLELSVAAVWRVRGVSWPHLDVLYFAMCGAVTALAYGLMRLCAGPVIAIGGACLLASSPLNLILLSNIRDYFKAPFQMALILVMGCLVLYGTSRRRVLGLACLGGAVLGIGIGFRPDVLLGAAPMTFALLVCLPLAWRGTLLLRFSAVALFVATTMVTGAPILMAYGEGGNTPHVMYLGFADPFTEALGIRNSDYDVLPLYNDRNAELEVRSEVVRQRRGNGNLSMNTGDYDREMSAYFRRVVRALPADMIARSLAAVLKIFESPFDWEATQHCQHLSGMLQRVCDTRMPLLSQLRPFAVPLVLLALAGIVAASPRVGLFGLIIVAFYAGGAAIQFNERHYFYLEFMPWWALALLLQRAVDAGWRIRQSGRRGVVASLWPWERWGLIALALVIVGVGGSLVAARAYQDQQVRKLLAGYRAAAAAPVAMRWRMLESGQMRAEVDDDRLVVAAAEADAHWQTHSIGTDFFRAEFGGADCDYALVVPTVRYTSLAPYDDLSAPFPIRLPPRGAVVSAFVPVYSAVVTVPNLGLPYGTTRFAGLEMSAAQARCLVGLRRVVDLASLPFLWRAIVRSPQDVLPYYQTLARWEDADTGSAPRLYSAGTAGVSQRDLVAPMPGPRESLDTIADAGRVEGSRIIIDGPIETPVSVLLISQLRTLPGGARAVLQGRLDRGAITVGLADGKQLLDATTISQAGPFAISFATPVAGSYRMVVRNRDGRLRHGTRLVIDRFGWVPEPPEPPQSSAAQP